MSPGALSLIAIVTLCAPVAAAPPTEVRTARTDSFGDPLPKAAIARLGTIRWKGSERIGAMAISPDGKLLAAACSDGHLRLWDFPSGVLLRRYDMPVSDGLGTIAFSADQKHIVFGGLNVTSPYFIDVTTGKLYYAGRAMEAPIAGGCTVSSSGRWAAAWQNDGVKWWFTRFDLSKPAKGHDLGSFPFKLQFNVSLVAISPDGRWCAIGGFHLDNPVNPAAQVHLIDVTTGKSWTSPSFALNNLNRFAFSADSQSLLVATQLSFFRWEIKAVKGAAPEMKLATTYQQPPLGAYLFETIAVSKDGKYVAGGTGNGSIVVWNLASGKQERSWQVSALNVVTGLEFTPDGKTIAVTTDLDVGVRFFDIASGAEHFPRTGHKGAISAIVFHPSGKALASSSEDDCSIRTWDLTVRRTPVVPGNAALVEERVSGREHAVLQRSNEAFRDIAFADNGRLLFASQPGGGPIVIWDTTKKQRPRELAPVDAGRIMAVAPDGGTVALALPQTGAQLIDARTGILLKVQPVIAESVESFCFSDDGKTLTIGTGGGRLIMWDVVAGRECRPRLVNARGIGARYFASAVPSDAATLIWDRTNARLVRRLDQTNAIGALSPDGRYFACLASGGIDLREVATGKVMLTWANGAAQMRVLRFSPDGSMVAAGYGDGTIVLWDARPPRSSQARLPDQTDLAKAFDEMGSSDPATSFVAMGVMASAPLESIKLIRDKFKLPQPIDPEVLAQLLAYLEHPRYSVREKATRRLEAVAGQVEDQLEKALARSGAETERRIERVLQSTRQPIADGETLRGLRLVELLERIGTAPAREQLQRFAEAQGPIAREARDSLERLRDR